MQQIKEGIINDSLGALPVVDIIDNKNALGEVFYVSVNTALNTLNIASPITISLATPDTTKLVSLSIIAIVTAGAILEVFEDTGDILEFNVTGGVQIIPSCRNRSLCCNSISDAVVYSGVTVTAATAAAALPVKRVGGLLGGEIAHRPCLILNRNTKYLFRVSTDADNNEGSLVLTWFNYICGNQ